MIDRGKDLIKEEGREEGKKEREIEIAKNLLDILEDETIAIKAGLSVEEVKELLKEELVYGELVQKDE